MFGTLEDTGKLLDLVAERAPRLHAAGVTSLSLGDLSFTLAPPAPPAAPAKAEDAPPPPASDPLADPSTYPGGRIPGFKRPGRANDDR